MRQLIGYDCFESKPALTLFETIYQDWWLYLNYFQPVLKRLDEHRVGSKVIKKYDTARTPYRCLIATSIENGSLC